MGYSLAGFSTMVAGFLGTWGVIAYYAGRTTKAVETVTETAKKHEERLEKLDDRVEEHGGRIIRLEERFGHHRS